jgi:hypothetical protein
MPRGSSVKNHSTLIMTKMSKRNGGLLIRKIKT